ncbi:MAG: hypothetical protein KDI09_11440, partial [Halioglobus sp.]|nr:hypothetical protein [Halioglobus sp.]
MFADLQTDSSLSSEAFDAAELPLRQRLLKAQMALAEKQRPVIIVVAGVDGAGKGALIHRLNEWMDPRGIDTNTFWEPSDEEESRPYFWRFWRTLPRRGHIGIFLGSWYTYPAQAAVAGEINTRTLRRHAQDIVRFEKMLVDDGALIIKLWLHVSRSAQRKQLLEDAGKQQNPRVTDQPYELSGSYRKTLKVSSTLIELTDTEDSRWQLLAAEDRRYRDITAGEIILNAMRKAAKAQPNRRKRRTRPARATVKPAPTVLDNLDLDIS